MITDGMTLTTRNDAHQWAADLIEGQELNHPEHVEAALGDWIWDNKPRPNSTYDEHPIGNIDTERFTALLLEYDG